MTVTPIDREKSKPSFNIGDRVQITKGAYIDQEAVISEIRERTARLLPFRFGWVCFDDIELLEAAPARDSTAPSELALTVDGKDATIVLDGKTGGPIEERLIEVPIEDLNQQWADQYDAWAAADTESKEARGVAKDERKKLDKLAAELRRRLKDPSMQLALSTTL